MPESRVLPPASAPAVSQILEARDVPKWCEPILRGHRFGLGRLVCARLDLQNTCTPDLVPTTSTLGDDPAVLVDAQNGLEPLGADQSGQDGTHHAQCTLWACDSQGAEYARSR